MQNLNRKKNSFFTSLAGAWKLLYRIQGEIERRRLDTSKWPDISAKDFQDLWEITRALAAECLEQAENTTDPKQKRMWISHGLRALRLAGKWLEQHKYDELEARLQELEERQKEQEQNQAPYMQGASLQ